MVSRETIGAPDATDRLARTAANRVNTYAVQRGYELLTRIAGGLIIGPPETARYGTAAVDSFPGVSARRDARQSGGDLMPAPYNYCVISKFEHHGRDR